MARERTEKATKDGKGEDGGKGDEAVAPTKGERGIGGDKGGRGRGRKGSGKGKGGYEGGAKGEA